MQILKLFVFLLLAFLEPFFAYANETKKQTDNVALELFANDENELLLKFSIADGWHIYFSNPGEIGKPTYIENLNSENLLEITDKSVPQAIKAYELMDEYIYKDTAYYKLRSESSENLKFAVNFVECADVCKTQKEIFDIKKMPNNSPEEWQKILLSAEETFPTQISSNFDKNQKQIIVDFPLKQIIKIIPDSREIVSGEEFFVTQKEEKTIFGWQNINEKKKLKSFLVITPEQSLNIKINYDAFDWFYFIHIVLLAFMGGIVLNAMPCVFPILSLKLFSIIKHHSKRHRWQNAISYSAGVVCSFLALAAILDILKEGGEAIGWGFQLQSPIFVFVMMILFLLLFLYTLNVFSFPTIKNRWLYKISGANMFLTGFFAVLIASPCTGPFMGAAIGYAFMQTDSEMYAVFLALALGYALPFALAEMYPHFLQRILPKPGAWMEKLKIILAIPLLLTCIWLATVLVAQMYSRDGINKNNLNWRKYSAEEIQNEISEGKKVFIDFTAEWCLTCMLNEKTRLNSKKFADFIRNNEVELFKADLTESNEEYNDALNAYGRDGIPVYIYYESEKYRILPIFFDIDELLVQ